ncbi:MAG TPA: acetyl-CoA carboxylase biotin carboxylase subunit [Gemmatimonadales bacterium]
MKRVLIANRGEIACRIIRACHEEGLEAVAVFSEADRLSPHVHAADVAVEIGPAPSRESYLNPDRLLDAARVTAADAVHPGYGFLAERAAFAEAVTDAGLIFIGPTADAIRSMGEKTEARRRMEAAGVAVVPGTTGAVASVDAIRAVADDIGYPIMLKAAAGGGGKGMRRVDDPDALASAFRAAGSEAESAFGDAAVYVEKCIEHPRHVEIQVLADRHGRTLHLGERECSIQRRHQKLVEESPSPAVSSERRLAMGQAAVQAAQSVAYLGAGTVEFLLAPDGQFYFLEMNTRIQVEHPVTELVYGVDLVREQLRIAAGKPTTVDERVLRPRGHAIECRITSEDPFNGFLPATGQIEYMRVPSGPGVRWDGGIEIGSDVGMFYDPLLGKLIVWGETRDVAIRRMRRALDELIIVGVPTAQGFHRRVMDEPAFVRGEYDIEYMTDHGQALLSRAVPDRWLDRAAVAAALAEHASRSARLALADDGTAPNASPWLVDARRRGLR